MAAENQIYDRVKDLGDYITLKTALSKGSTSRLVRHEPDDPSHWWLIAKMLKEDAIHRVDPDTRWCPKCGEDRPKRLFGKDKTNWDGVRGWCKPCVAAEEKRRYWLKKDSDEMWGLWHQRHILRLDTEKERAA